MVIIAIAGSTGEVAREIIDALVATKKHAVVLLTRKLPGGTLKDVSALPVLAGTRWVQVDYHDTRVSCVEYKPSATHANVGSLTSQWSHEKALQPSCAANIVQVSFYAHREARFFIFSINHPESADDRLINGLVEALRGVEVVLSFITPQTDPDNEAQKNLIDASIAAGVKRFAPSEWATSSVDFMPWYAGKHEIQQYLQKVNEEKQRIEYTLFQPGLFLNYLTHPHQSANHVHSFETQFDFEKRRAIVPDCWNDVTITLTMVQDLANVVAKAVEYEGTWPVVGGVKGCDLSIAELIYLGEEIRGGPFSIEELDVDALREGFTGYRWSGTVASPWLPKINHSAIPPDQAATLAEMFLVGLTLGMANGALRVSNEWNKIFPEHKFMQPREFLTNAWKGKP